MERLPIEAQFAPIYGISIDDFDLDGKLDVFLSGNNQGANVNTGYQNALKGSLLMGNGNCTFNPRPQKAMSFEVSGETRSAANILHRGVQKIILAKNSNPLQVLKPTKSAEYLEVPSNLMKVEIEFKMVQKEHMRFIMVHHTFHSLLGRLN